LFFPRRHAVTNFFSFGIYNIYNFAIDLPERS
jgi:hypothetical protein